MPNDELTTLSFKEPTRLGELSGPGSVLSNAIADARARGPSDAHLQALRDAVWAGIAGTTVIGAAAAAATHLRPPPAVAAAQIGGSLGATKVVLGLTFAGLLSAGAVIGVKGIIRAPVAHKAAGAARLHPTERTRADDMSPEGSESPPGSTLAVESPTGLVRTQAGVAPKGRGPAPPVPSRSGGARGQRGFAPASARDVSIPPTLDSDEGFALLARAQQSLTTDPASSLSLTQEFARRFSPGALDQERDMLAVEALRALGRRQEAIAQARQLLEHYRSSPYATKLERMFPDESIVPDVPAVRARQQK